MATGRSREEKTISQKEFDKIKMDLDKIRRWLIGGVEDTEKLILKYYEKNKTKELTNLNGLYTGMLEYITKQLYDISSMVVENTNIEDVKNYKKSKDTPENFLNYLNASENLAAAIMHDLLSQPDGDHAQLAMERWITISRMCYQLNDFSSCAAIITALGVRAIARTKLHECLSPAAEATLKYFEKLITKPDWVLEVQNQCIGRGEQVVPYLNSLPHVIERTETRMELRKTNSKKKMRELDRVRRGYSSVTQIKRYHQTDQIENILDLLYIPRSDDIYDQYGDKSDELESSLYYSMFQVNDVIDKLHLYDGYLERYFYQLHKLIVNANNYSSGKLVFFYSNATATLFDLRLSEEAKYVQFSKLIHEYRGDIDKTLKMICKKINIALLDLIANKPKKPELTHIAGPRRHKSAGDQQLVSPRREHKKSKEKLEKIETIETKETKDVLLEKADTTDSQAALPKQVESPILTDKNDSQKSILSSPDISQPDVEVEPKEQIKAVTVEEAAPIELSAPSVEKLPAPIKQRVVTPLVLPSQPTSPSAYSDEISEVESTRVVTSRRRLFEDMIERHASQTRSQSNIRALVSDRYFDSADGVRPPYRNRLFSQPQLLSARTELDDNVASAALKSD